MKPEKIQELSSPEAVANLLRPPQSYGNGYLCCSQLVALCHALVASRKTSENLRVALDRAVSSREAEADRAEAYRKAWSREKKGL